MTLNIKIKRMKKSFLAFILIAFSNLIFAQNNCAVNLDTSRMNTVLPNFISQLKAQNLKDVARFSDVPSFIKETLNCIGNFKIAERGDLSYQSDCLRYPSSPYRKVEYIGMNDEYLLMSYRLGGLIEQPHVLIVHFKDKKVMDIWSGQGFGKSKEKILMQLEKIPFAALNWI
jgi:hypothetical protein